MDGADCASSQTVDLSRRNARNMLNDHFASRYIATCAYFDVIPNGATSIGLPQVVAAILSRLYSLICICFV